MDRAEAQQRYRDDRSLHINTQVRRANLRESAQGDR